MSELDLQPTRPAPQDALGATLVGAGAQLRAAREAQGLHIGALAVALKVPVKKLEALEADRFDLLPGIVFSRALALSVCRTLRLDPQPILARLPQTNAAAAVTDLSGLNTTFKPVRMGGPLFSLPHFANPATLAVLLLLLAIAAVYFWPLTPGSFGSEVGSAPGAAESAPISAPVSPSAAITIPRESVASEAVVLADSKGLGPIASPGGPATASVAEASAISASPASPAPLRMQARGQSWVEVTDAQGKMQLRKLTSEGEVIELSGPLPLSVVLGRADLVAVYVRGDAVDLSAVSTNNVARFEVK